MKISNHAVLPIFRIMELIQMLIKNAFHLLDIFIFTFACKNSRSAKFVRDFFF